MKYWDLGGELRGEEKKESDPFIRVAFECWDRGDLQGLLLLPPVRLPEGLDLRDLVRGWLEQGGQVGGRRLAGLGGHHQELALGRESLGREREKGEICEQKNPLTPLPF